MSEKPIGELRSPQFMKKLMRFFILALVISGSSCQVKNPFVKESKYSMRSPASVTGGDEYIVSGEYSQKELSLGLSFCQDLRALRFAWPFINDKEKILKFDKRYYGSDGNYQEKLNFESRFGNTDLYLSEMMTDQVGESVSFCNKMLRNKEILDDTEMLISGELVQRHFLLTSDKQKVFTVTRAISDAKGQFVVTQKESFYMSTLRDGKHRGMIVKYVKERLNSKDPDQAMERFEQILHE